MSPKLTSLSALIALPVSLFVFSGCGKNEPEYVEVQNVEKAAPAVDEHAGHNHAPGEGHAVHADGAAAPEGVGFAYETPEGWTQMPPSSMKLLSFNAGAAPQLVAECAVSAFPGDVGGRLANINRWRRQVGLGPTTEEVAEAMVGSLTISGMDAWQVDFTGPAGTGMNGGALRTVVSVVFHNGQSWFFKLTGNDSVVEDELAAYAEFLKSVKF
jgi:hypothetical protein